MIATVGAQKLRHGNIVLIFALVLLSPLPFVSPFSYNIQPVQAEIFYSPQIPGNYKSSNHVLGNAEPAAENTSSIIIKTFTIKSNNSNNNVAYAKAGDRLTLILVINDTIKNHTVNILNGTNYTTILDGAPSDQSFINDSLEIILIVSNNTFESYATFNITVTNSKGDIRNITQTDLTSNIFVDTIPPTITLDEPADYTIVQNDSNLVPNATANDGDPNYSGNYILISNATVNTTILGSVYNYTYTAYDDDAGNPGASATRIVRIVKATPINVTSLSIASDSGNNYANAGKTITVTLATDSTDLDRFDGTLLDRPLINNTNGGSVTFTATILSGDDGNATFSITLRNSSGGRISLTNDNITDSSYVIIDTTPPRITLNGANDTLVYTNSTFVDQNATASDASYATGSIQVPGNVTVNTAISGTYTLFYTAPNDLAGNVGPTIIRNIIVQDASPINITRFTITSNNNNSSYAKTNDTLILTLVINDTIASYTASFFNRTLDPGNPSTSELNLTVTVPSDAIESYATFNIIITNNDGVNRIITNDDLTSENIFVDTIGPRIFLIGSKNYNIGQGAIVSSIPNVTIIDEDPSYAGNFTIITNGTLDTSINDLVILYTYTASQDGAGNPGSSVNRTVMRINTESSSSNTAPTLGKTSSGAQLVTKGFEYNGLAVNVSRYHTEFPLIETNVGDINTIKVKVYDSVGPAGIKRVEFALGVPDVGLYHESEAFVEVWMQRDNITVQEIIIKDKLNLLENSDVSSTISQISCSKDEQQCLLVEMKYSYREAPIYNTVSVKPVDWDNNAHQFYFNDGIHVNGNSINIPKEIDISASHTTSISHTGETLHLVQINRAEHLWIDQYGYQWIIIGNTVRQITALEYLVPDDNTYGTLHGPDRNHPDFASIIYAEQKKAQETLAGILGHGTIMKPLPESGLNDIL